MTTITKRKSPLRFGESFTFGKFQTSRELFSRVLLFFTTLRLNKKNDRCMVLQKIVRLHCQKKSYCNRSFYMRVRIVID